MKGDSAKYKKYSNFFDIILIDGSHKYENVILDSENSKMIKNKGYIIWHDYSKDHSMVKSNKFNKEKIFY